MIEVEIPDKKMIIEFPDGMKQQDIMSVINEQVYGQVVETEIPTSITRHGRLDIGLSLPDVPESIIRPTVRPPVPTLEAPPYEGLGLPVGEPRVLGKAIDIPFIPGREIARAPGAFTEAEPFDIERKEASISDLGGQAGRKLLETLHEQPGPKKVKYKEGEMRPGDIGEWIGRLVAEIGVEVPTANIMIRTLAGTIGSTARAIRESTAWRKLTIPERRLTIQSLDDVIRNNPDMTEGEILRRWGAYKDEALSKRIKPEAVATGKPPIEAEAPTLKPPIEKPTAKFIGYQEVPGKPSMPIYNIVGGKRHGSTVTAPTLKAEGIAIPETPKEKPTLKAKVKEPPEKIVSAVTSIDGKVFEGKTHGESMNKAIKAGFVKETRDGFVDRDGHNLYGTGHSDLFKTSRGRIIDRFEASREFGITAGEDIKPKEKPTLKPPEEIKVTGKKGKIEEPTHVPAGKVYAVKVKSKKDFGKLIDDAIKRVPFVSAKKDSEFIIGKPATYSGTKTIDVRHPDSDLMITVEKGRNDYGWTVYVHEYTSDKHPRKVSNAVSPEYDYLPKAKEFARAYIKGETDPKGHVIFKHHKGKYEYKIFNSKYALEQFKKSVSKSTQTTFASIGEPKKGPIPGEPKKPRKPIITTEQKKRMAKKKEVKEKQINIESAKEAKEQVRKMIIQRRKNLNLASYETNLFVNEIEKITTKAQREVIPFIIEKTDVPKELKRPDIEKEYAKNKEMLTPLADQVQKYFDASWQNMKKHIPDMSAEQIENYVTHIWDLNKKQKRAVTNWFITQNRFLKKRYIATLKEGIDKLGLKPRTLDIGEIIRIHDGVMNRAIENKKFVDDLKKLRKDDVPLIERADKAPQDWVYFDHPALQRALVIPGEGVMGEKISPALASLLDDMGVAIGRRISPIAWGKPVQKVGEYKAGGTPEVRFQRFMSNKTIAHEIGHHLDEVLELGEGFLNRYKSELYAINRERIESKKGDPGKYGQAYAESKEEQIAEYFATLFTDADKAYKLAPNATVDALERLKQDGVLSKLIDFDFEKGAKNLIEEQLNTMVKLPVKVHPDLEKPLKVIFDSRIDHAVIRAYELVNGILKKSVLSLSLFHHAALGETGIATMGATKTLNIYLNPVKIYNAMVRGEYDIYKKETIAKDAIKAGLQVGATHDIPVRMIQNKLNALARKSKNIPLAKQTTQFIATFNEKWDKALWDYLHDTLKLHAYESLTVKIDPTKNIAKQKTEIAQFVNDTFGGQNWDMMMLSPKTVQMMTWSLLSADWTTSTIRQALSPTGIGAIHEETKGLRKKLGRYFWIKAGLYFGVGINMLNYTFRKWDEKENPQYYKDIKMTFWDRTMAGNTIGKKTNLFVGRYEDGTERYIRWGKQFRELFEFFYDDTGFSPISAALKKIGGKLAPLMQLVSQIFTGVSPSGFRNDDVYGKKGWDKTYGIFKTLIKSPLPFASRNLLIKDKEFHITDIAFPSSKGMTRYRSIEFFKHAIMKNDERFLKEVYQDTLKNNLPAYTLFNAAIVSLKAETSRELNASRKEMDNIKIALKKAMEIGDIQDIKRIENRLKRIAKETLDRRAGIKAYNLALIKLRQYQIETNPKKQTGRLILPNKSKNGRLLKGD